MKRNNILSYFLILVLFLSCSKDDINENQILPIAPNLSSSAKFYLEEVLDIMESRSINRYKIDWSMFREVVLKEANGAQTTEDTYPAVRKAIVMLEDNHSFLKTPEGEVIVGVRSICFAEDILPIPNLSKDIGYVRVGSFSGLSNSEEAISYAEEIQSQIKTNDHSEIEGWIVDLRGNTGGNMWPMVAGIGPILGEGIAGFFVDPDDNKVSWSFMNGASQMNQRVITQLNDSYGLINPNPKVAILLDNEVASSGEVVAISFIGKENTKSFGSFTCGQSTANASYKLSDDSTLLLTVSVLADRNEYTYGESIFPDNISSKDNIIDDAINWIKSN